MLFIHSHVTSKHDTSLNKMLQVDASLNFDIGINRLTAHDSGEGTVYLYDDHNDYFLMHTIANDITYSDLLLLNANSQLTADLDMEYFPEVDKG
ncbi:hypothetical protein GOP47_0024034 [Adiantum capillus-veneris]|uniref:Uncharacterized protein n=1 Tax=Adiantum capillus-veneris TaxID=13818 RepID=A0A9D4U6S3_ADICA|nr:hypothetical protein GOP47_0024034 [Adiantum capillus-veneris]